MELEQRVVGEVPKESTMIAKQRGKKVISEGSQLRHGARMQDQPS